MGTAIVILILILVVCLAIKGSLKHYKGEGGCCGGGNEPKVKKQKLDKVIREKKIVIDGMMCENCRKSVENALNSIENVNAKVNLERREALLKLGADIPDDVFMEAVKSKGYRVVSVQNL